MGADHPSVSPANWPTVRSAVVSAGVEPGAVYFEDDAGHLQSIPAKWTDVIAADPFVVIAAGRALFRPDDLIEVTRLIDAAMALMGDTEEGS